MSDFLIPACWQDLAQETLEKLQAIDPNVDVEFKEKWKRLSITIIGESTNEMWEIADAAEERAGRLEDQFMDNLYDRPQNLLRKATVLRGCIERLERLQEDYAPIFNDDPMIAGYLKQMREDYQDIQKVMEGK